MNLTGSIVFAKKGRDFSQYRVLTRTSVNGEFGQQLVEVNPGGSERPVTVVFPHGSFPSQSLTDEDIVRRAVVVDRDRQRRDVNSVQFRLTDDDVSAAELWETQRSQVQVVHDVLALLCEATVAGLCMAGKDFRVVSVLASVRGAREQVVEAITFLIRHGDLGTQPSNSPVDAATALYLIDFWTSVTRLGSFRAVQVVL